MDLRAVESEMLFPLTYLPVWRGGRRHWWRQLFGVGWTDSGNKGLLRSLHNEGKVGLVVALQGAAKRRRHCLQGLSFDFPEQGSRREGKLGCARARAKRPRRYVRGWNRESALVISLQKEDSNLSVPYHRSSKGGAVPRQSPQVRKPAERLENPDCQAKLLPASN
jgi:hypothetical protein